MEGAGGQDGTASATFPPSNFVARSDGLIAPRGVPCSQDAVARAPATADTGARSPTCQWLPVGHCWCSARSTRGTRSTALGAQATQSRASATDSEYEGAQRSPKETSTGGRSLETVQGCAGRRRLVNGEHRSLCVISPRGGEGGSAGGRGKGRGRGGGGKPRERRLQGDEMLAALVRDHLHLRSDVSAIQTATNIVVAMYDAELKKKVQHYGEAWDDAQKEAKATEQDGGEDLSGAAEEEGGGGTKQKTRKGDGKGKGRPHPLGCGKRVVAMVALGEWLAEKESSLAGNKQKDAVRQQLLVETQEMSDMVVPLQAQDVQGGPAVALDAESPNSHETASAVGGPRWHLHRQGRADRGRARAPERRGRAVVGLVTSAVVPRRPATPRIDPTGGWTHSTPGGLGRGQHREPRRGGSPTAVGRPQFWFVRLTQLLLGCASRAVNLRARLGAAHTQPSLIRRQSSSGPSSQATQRSLQTLKSLFFLLVRG